jgi:adenylate cyclase
MGLKSDIEAQAKTVLNESWDIRDGRIIPDTESVALKGGAVRIRATILFCDLVASSQLTEQYQKRTAAKVYKAFLGMVARIASNNGGTITAFDGDRIMVAFAGDGMCNNAVRTAMQTTWSMDKILDPLLRQHFASMQGAGFAISHCSGIDVGEIFVVKAGNRAANDLVWVGRATNMAARLSEVRIQEKTLITVEVYRELDDNHRLAEGKDMWVAESIPFAGETQQLGKTRYSWPLT